MTLLKRHKPLGFFRLIRELLWPSMGWVRTWHYYRHRLLRQKDSIYRLTAGLATGISVSFSPILGTHFLQAALISWLLRASIPAALIGTFVGMPWTYPFIFAVDYKIGILFCDLFGLKHFVTLPQRLPEGTLEFLLHLLKHPMKLFLPLMIGGTLSGIVLWPLSYTLLYRPIHMAQRLHRLQRLRRIRKKQGR